MRILTNKWLDKKFKEFEKKEKDCWQRDMDEHEYWKGQKELIEEIRNK